MPPDLSHLVLRFHLDAAGFALLAGVAWVSCHRFVQRRQAADNFHRFIGPLVALLGAGGWLLSRWPGATLAAGGAAESVLLYRVVVWAVIGALGGVLVASWVYIALLRARLRRHAAAEHQLEQARAAADQASRSKGDFLAVMSHEIRTPLNALLGFSGLLADTKLDDAQRDYLGTINREGLRLRSLIDDILDLTKMEEGYLTLERLPFAPAETAAEVLRLLGPRAAEKNLELRFEAQLAGPLMIAGDPLRFRQILLNLIDNAVKFTARGSVTLFLLWDPPARGESLGRLEVRVRDTGIGIPADKVKDLFKKFAQAEPSTARHYGGSGLGLAICHRLVGLMGGEITGRSAPGEGAEFSFVLPVASVTPPEEMLPAPEPSTPAGPQPAILVVDDLETNRALLTAYLGRNGFAVDVARSGAEAVQRAGNWNYDAILMDIHMPDMDGFDATRHIRAAERPGRRTPILALTAALIKGTREKCLAADMDGCLTKPLDLRKLKRLLDELATEGPGSTAARLR